MPDPAKITEEEAYKQFTAALRRGQEGLDELDPEVKKLAMGPAEASLGAPSWSDPTDPSSEGFDIVEEVAPDYGYKPIENLPPIVKQEFDALPEAVPRKDPSAEGYEPIEAVAPPDPDAGKEYESREDYKGFKAPKGMSAEQSEAWKAGVDDRLLESDERLQERIESAHPADQAQDLLRRASEGDLEAIKDIGYLGLNIAAMSPIGQIPQMGADAGVGVMDLAEGDYTGAAISGAAVVLPVTAGMLKAAIKNPAAAKIVSKLDDVDPHTSGSPGDPDDYIKHLVERGAAEDIAKLSDDELIDAYKGLSEANIVIRRGVKESDLVGDLATTKDLDVPPYTRGGSVDAADTTEEAFARTYATKELLKNELQDRALDNPAIAKQFAQRMAKVDKGTVLERKKHLKSYNDEMKELTKAAPPLVSAGMVKQIMKRDYGDEARDILINHGQIGYEIEQALLKSRGKVTDAIKELQEYRSSLGDNLMKAIQDTEKITPMDMGKLDSDLMHSADYSLDEIIEAAKQGKTLPALGPAFGKEGGEYDYLLENSEKTGAWLEKRKEAMKAAGGKETAESLELKEIADFQQHSWDPPGPRMRQLIEKHTPDPRQPMLGSVDNVVDDVPQNMRARFDILNEGWGGNSQWTSKYITEMQHKALGAIPGKLSPSVYEHQLSLLQEMGSKEARILIGDIKVSRAEAQKIFADNARHREMMVESISRGEGNFKPTIVNKDPVRSPDYNPNKLGDDEWGY